MFHSWKLAVELLVLPPVKINRPFSALVKLVKAKLPPTVSVPYPFTVPVPTPDKVAPKVALLFAVTIKPVFTPVIELVPVVVNCVPLKLALPTFIFATLTIG